MPSECVKVMVRVRPMNQREKDKSCKNIVEADTSAMQITLTNPEDTDTQKVFSFDAVFPQNSQQQTVYEQAAFQLVESVIEGYNGTIFAYGQTGCGKTHTMMGVPNNEELRGIIPRAFAHIFGNIESNSSKNFLVRCSYIEIYNEEIHDLIGPDVKAKLELKESPEKGLFIKNLTMSVVKSIPEIERLMILGTKNRSVGETAMNKDSSRSHSIFTIYIEASESDDQGNQRITAGKLNLVDLAGSERQSKTQATGDRLKEANKINLSLSALGNVISALVDGKSSHVPYRDSKLTRLLQDSLGGNTKTVMVANVSPASDNYDETLGTLRYASRAKNIKNQPKVNEDPKDAMLREYAEEIQRLKALLQNGGGAGAIAGTKSGEKRSMKDASPVNKGKGKERYENELKQTEDQMLEERRKREELEARLKQFEKQMVGGQNAKDTETDEKRQYQEMLQKLKHQEEIEADILREKRQKEEEVMLVEKKYSSLQEEVEDLRKVLKKLRKKYKNAKAEVDDLNREHELGKEDLLDTIRLLEKDARSNFQIMIQVLPGEEIEKIKRKAKWIDEKNEFIVPPFLVRQRKVKFPKLPYGQAFDMVKEDWRNREIEILEEEEVESPDSVVAAFWGNRDGPSNSRISLGAPMGNRNSRNKDDSFQMDKYSIQKSSSKESLNSSPTQKGTKSTLNSHAPRYNSNASSVQNSYKFESQMGQKKMSGKNILLEPINADGIINRNPSGYRDKYQEYEPTNNLPSVKGRGSKFILPLLNQIGQLKPLSNLNNNRGMKLQFKATVLINNDGNQITGAELRDMDFEN